MRFAMSNGSSLTAVMSGAAATTNPSVNVEYRTVAGEASTRVALSGASTVTLFTGTEFNSPVVTGLSVYNDDTAAVTVTINHVISGTSYPITKATLAVNDTLTVDAGGMKVTDVNGKTKTSTTAGGTLTATSLTAEAATLPINGLAAAQGGSVTTTGGTSSTSGNAGGAVGLVGGTPGATGVGGAVSVTGGAGGATSGTGGAVAVAGGAGTAGNANGGAVTVLAGNAHGSGTDGTLGLGTSNTSAVNIGATDILTTVSGYLQNRGSYSVTATVGGGTTGLIPAGASFVVVTSDDANKQISLPAGTVGDRIRILVGATGCELIAVTAADKVNDVVVGATNEAALTATNLYDCQYVATNTWVVIGYTKLGAVQAALVPDSL